MLSNLQSSKDLWLGTEVSLQILRILQRAKTE